MATIQGVTARGLRLLPALTAGQALGLLATAAAVRLAWALPGASAARAALALAAASAGAAYAIGRWPPGPDGERLAIWLPRLLRYCLRPHVRCGSRLAGWEGLRDLRSEVLRHERGWAAVIDCTGTDCVARGPEAAAAAQVAYRELLHALEGPLEVVAIVRWLAAGDRPPLWDPAAAPSGLAPVASAYSAHWDALVRARRGVARRCLFVMGSAAPPGLPPPDVPTLQGAMSRLAVRLGLTARAVEGQALARLLRECAGAADAAGSPSPTPDYRVGGARA